MDEIQLLQLLCFILSTSAALTWSLVGGNKIVRHGDKNAPPPPQSSIPAPTTPGTKAAETAQPKDGKEVAAAAAGGPSTPPPPSPVRRNPMKRIKNVFRKDKETTKPASIEPRKVSKSKDAKKKALSAEVKPKTKDQPKDAKKTPAVIPNPSPAAIPPPIPVVGTPTKSDEAGKKPVEKEGFPKESKDVEKKKDEKEQPSADTKKDKKTTEERTVDPTMDQTENHQAKITKEATIEAAELQPCAPTFERNPGELQPLTAVPGTIPNNGQVQSEDQAGVSVFKKAGNVFMSSYKDTRNKFRKTTTPPGTSATTTTTTTSTNEATPPVPDKHNKFLSTLKKFKNKFESNDPKGSPTGASCPEVTPPPNDGISPSPTTPAVGSSPSPVPIGVSAASNDQTKTMVGTLIQNQSHDDDALKNHKKEITVEMESGNNNMKGSDEADPEATPTVFEKINAPVKPLQETPRKRSKLQRNKAHRHGEDHKGDQAKASNSTETKDSNTTGTTLTDDDNSNNKCEKKKDKEKEKGKDDEKLKDEKKSAANKDKIEDSKPNDNKVSSEKKESKDKDEKKQQELKKEMEEKSKSKEEKSKLVDEKENKGSKEEKKN